MENLAFGLQITVVGMGLVFGLLALLWALLALAGRLEPRPQAPPPPADEPAAEIAAGETALRVEGAGVEQLSPEALAAIAAAVLAHAANRRGQAAPEMRSYWPGSLLFASRWVAAGRDRQTRGYKRERS